MNLLLPKFRTPTRVLDQVWQAVKGRSKEIAERVSHRHQLPLAFDLARAVQQRVLRPEDALQLSEQFFGPRLCGAGHAFESRRWMNPASDAAIATTGANTVNFNAYDFWAVTHIGFYWTVTGTVTAMVMDFDLYARLFASTLLADKLNGADGVLSGGTFTIASQAAGNMWVKDLGDNKGEIDVTAGQSIQAIVTTTTTAGNGMPFVLGYPRAESYRNIATAIYQNP